MPWGEIYLVLGILTAAWLRDDDHPGMFTFNALFWWIALPIAFYILILDALGEHRPLKAQPEPKKKSG